METWNAADADQDGMLNSAEFGVFYESDKKVRADNGLHISENDDRDQIYAIANKITEGTEGLKLMDYYTVLGRVTMKILDLKNAA